MDSPPTAATDDYARGGERGGSFLYGGRSQDQESRRGGEEAEQAIGAEKKIFKNFGLN
jgi:hypothetical protein